MDCSLPAPALVRRYQGPGNHVDCLTVVVPGAVTIALFAEAFLTARAFRLERWAIGLLLGKRSSDSDAAALATGQSEVFSAWTVEARDEDQLLLSDFLGHTRSWYMVERLTGPEGAPATRLYFGTAIVRAPMKGTARRLWRPGYWLLLPFHRLYARVLLRSAARRLKDSNRTAS